MMTMVSSQILRKIIMYYNECPFCGCNLDPGERCKCRGEKEKKKRKVEDLLTVSSGGQIVLKEAIV